MDVYHHVNTGPKPETHCDMPTQHTGPLTILCNPQPEALCAISPNPKLPMPGPAPATNGWNGGMGRTTRVHANSSQTPTSGLPISFHRSILATVYRNSWPFLECLRGRAPSVATPRWTSWEILIGVQNSTWWRPWNTSSVKYGEWQILRMN